MPEPDDRIFLMGGPRGMLVLHERLLPARITIPPQGSNVRYEGYTFVQDLDIPIIYWYVKGENDDDKAA